MLAELAAANAAYQVIKTTVQNGGELMSIATKIGEYFDNKKKIYDKANKDGYKSDMEAFFALEQLKQKEKELQELFIYCGRAGLWEDWLKFQAEAKNKRQAKIQAEKIAILKKKQFWYNLVKTATITFFAIGAMILSMWGLYWLIKNKGNYA